MKLTIEIDCDNDAFQWDNGIGEVGKVINAGLIGLNEALEDGTKSYKAMLFDSNGNDVGLLTYE